MNLLLFFILGIVAMRYIFPLLDQLLAWALNAIEVRKNALMVKQAKCEKEMADIAAAIDSPQTNQIGFVIPSDGGEDEEENDEDL